MITIEQLLESVDLDFEPRFVTKDKSGTVSVWGQKPERIKSIWYAGYKNGLYSHLKLAEFENKDWQDCIYEVPRKTIGKIESLDLRENSQIIPIPGSCHDYCLAKSSVLLKINELVDYTNALIESNNVHEKQIDKLQMKLEPEKCAINELKGE